MASSILRDLNDGYLTCGICMDSYDTPKILPCIHTFCQKCIGEYISAKGDPFPCPLCKQETKVPSGGVCHFQTNIMAVGIMDVVKSQGVHHHCSLCKKRGVSLPATCQCIDCNDYLCDNCGSVHTGIRVLKNHKIILLGELSDKDIQEQLRSKQETCCPVHKEEVIKYFCIQDQTAICHACTLMEHHGHKCESLSEAAEKVKSSLSLNLLILDPIISYQEKSIRHFQKEEDKFKEIEIDTIKKVEKWFTEMQTKIDNEKKRIENEIRATLAAENKKTLADKDQAEMSLASLKSTKDMGDQLIKHGKDAEVLLLHQKITERTKQLTIQGNEIPLSMSIIHLELLDHCMFDLAIKKTDAKVNQFVVKSQLNSCRFTSAACLPNGNWCLVDCNLLSSCLHSWYYYSPGINTSLRMFDPKGILLWDHPMGEPSPYNVAITADNNLMVTRINSSKIDIVDFNGKKVKSMYSCSTCGKPGLAVQGKDVILTDSSGKCIYICDITSDKKRKISNQQFQYPHSVAANDNYIIVSDRDAKRVFIYNRSGNLKATYCEIFNLAQPWGVCIDSLNNILVADYGGNKIHMISPQGKFVKFVLTKEELEGSPIALTITAAGYLMVTMDNCGLVKIVKYLF